MEKEPLVKQLGIPTEIKPYEKFKEFHSILQGWEYENWGSQPTQDGSPILNIYNNPENLSSAIKQSDDKGKNAKNEICSRENGIKPDEIIVAFEGISPKGICQVPKEFDFKHFDNIGNGLIGINEEIEWIDWEELIKNCPEDLKKQAKKVRSGQGVVGIQKMNTYSSIIKLIWENYKGRKNMNKLIENYKNLLLNCKNLVFTGAPGTGKTYLAREIAKSMIMQNNINHDQLDKNLKDIKDKVNNEIKDKEIDYILKQWAEYKDKILKGTLKLEEYVDLKPNKYLCNFLERNESDLFGSSKDFGQNHFGIYLKKEDKNYYNIKLEKFNNKQEAEEFYKEKILPTLQLILSPKSSEEIFTEIDKLGNDPKSHITACNCLRKMVILSYPNKFIPIYANELLKTVHKLLGLNYNKKDSYYTKNKNIVNKIKEIEKKEDLETKDLIAWMQVLCDPKIEAKLPQFIYFTQFHPSYDYTDFVEGLRPCKKEQSNDISFELKKGIFMEFCEKAENDKNNNYVFIIDEINRGEISKIFGELFASIEPSYRGNNTLSIKTQYHNLHAISSEFANSPFKNSFFVPSNVYIIGTMNYIDRSVESFDFALRRRFSWKEIKVEDTLESILNEININIEEKNKAKNRLLKLNEEIKKILQSDAYSIGGAYLLKLNDYTKNPFDSLWDNNIEPLLKEYLRGLPEEDEKLKELKNAYNLKEDNNIKNNQ